MIPFCLAEVQPESNGFSPLMYAVLSLGGFCCVVWLARAVRMRFRAQGLGNAPLKSVGFPLALVPVAYLAPQLVAILLVTPFWVAAKPDTMEARTLNLLSQGLTIITILLLAKQVTTPGGAGRLGVRIRPRDGVMSVFSWLCVMPICISVLFATRYLLRQYGVDIPQHESLTVLESGAPVWVRGLVIVSAVVMAPIAEELFFRCIVQRALRQYLSSWGTLAVASVVFTMVHGQLYDTWPTLFCLAMVLGYRYERTGRIGESILIHALFNATTVVSVLLSR